MEKFKKFDDSSKAIEKVDSKDDVEDHKHGDNNYYKKDSGKRRYYNKNYNNYNNYDNKYYGDDQYFDQALGQDQPKEEVEE